MSLSLTYLFLTATSEAVCLGCFSSLLHFIAVSVTVHETESGSSFEVCTLVMLHGIDVTSYLMSGQC